MLPIVERELRVQARNRRAFLLRVAAAVVASLATVVALLAASVESNPSRTGQFLFLILRWPLFAFCLFEGLRVAADAISVEKREGTLGLLLLTDLSPGDVVLGKLSGVSFNSVYALLATMPILATPLLLGGITVGEFWRTTLTLFVALGLSLMVGIAVSVRCRELLNSWSFTAVAMFIILALPYALAGATSRPWWSFMSPIAAMMGSDAAIYGSNASDFWIPIACMLVLSFGALLSAVLGLKSQWRDQPEAIAKAKLGGNQRAPRRPGDSLLRAGHPVAWLASRALPPRRRMTWAAVAVGSAGIIATALVDVSLGDIAWVILTFAVIHWAAALRQGLVAVGIGSELRHSGAVDLLLVTPLTSQEIVWALGSGAMAPVKPAAVIVFAAECVCLVLFGFRSFSAPNGSTSTSIVMGTMFGIYALSHLINLWTATWVGLYHGVYQTKRATALSWTVLWVLVIPMVTLVLCCFWGGLVVPLIISFVVLLWARDRLVFEFPRLVRPPEPAGTAPTPSKTTSLPRITPPPLR